MRKFWIGAVFTLLVTASAVADQINFNFINGASNSVTAASAGFVSGPSLLFSNIGDSTTGATVPCSGSSASPVCQGGNYISGNTGPAHSLMAFGTQVIGSFGPASAISVLVEDSMGHTLVSGTMQDGGALLSTIPNGTGSFLGTFDVTFVDPAVLALFGLGPAFLPNGSVSLTFGKANWNATTSTFTAALGTAGVTIQTPPIPEPASLGLLGMGILTVAGGLRLRKRTHGSPQ